MKILLGSHYFLPSTGGIEVVTNLLAREFTKRGHQVRIVTQTPGDAGFGFDVLRRPTARKLIAAVRWCDVFLQNNISLRSIWPLLFIRRPLFIIHQTWITAGIARPLKLLVTRHARSFAISGAIAGSLPSRSIILGNPFDESIFRDHGQPRELELIFVGRLVSDKGIDVLIAALHLLGERGLRPRLTIVGDGPERASATERVRQLELEQQVTFVGSKSGSDISELLNRHRILIVPSRLPEPFGIVALEGIACGCIVIGSAEGGLPEAIGGCGLTFPNGNADALADCLAELLEDDQKQAAFRAASGPHLAQFTSVKIAELYLEKIAAALR